MRRSSQRKAEKDPALPFFHRLRPLTSITKSDAQISGGETRQDDKDPRAFPGSSSCALLFLPFGLPVSFRCYAPRLSHSARLTLKFREGSSPQAGLYARTPVQLRLLRLSSGNYRLESNLT